MSTMAFGLAGLVAGSVEASLLARSVVRRGSIGGLVLRFLLVAVVLVTSARNGALLEAVLGWALAFLVAVLVLARRIA